MLRLVEEKGHGNVTTAEVARRARTSEATVLYHYPGKDHLLVAALEYADAASADHRDVVLDLAGLRAFVRVATTHREPLLRLHTVLAGHAATPDHPAAEYFARRHAAAIDEFRRLVEQRQRHGEAHPGLDAVDVARQIVAVWDGLEAQWLVDPSFDLAETLMRAIRRLTAQNWMDVRQTLLAPETGL
ncbi:TetR/AcrR family transcriptional regulator [Cryptosporangium minutisporangium]|uniref:TetR/AcrR family transcriptional regulator n=1 Tax=Cryptosporangium minutisporangium TaxID=113569 RepID=A0ABP6T602_9ACTN